MFYTENKISTYPNRRIVEDMMLRDGPASIGYTFSPYSGVRSRVNSKLINEYGVTFDPTAILDDFKAGADFSPIAAKANTDNANRDYRAADVTDYYMNLEDISESYVVKFIDSVLYNYRNHKGLGNLRYEMKSYNYFVDDEDGSLVNPTDLKELPRSYSVNEINIAKEKLPYLLKQIHYGSKKRGVSLLSFIITRQKLLQRESKSFYWHDYIDTGVYYMNTDGKVGARISREAQKDTAWSRGILDWINGLYQEDMYYRAYIELLRVLEVLNLDITIEDPHDFDEAYLSRILCTYVPSNREYLESYCTENDELLFHLKPEGLLETIKHIASNSQVEDSTFVRTRIADIATNLKSRFKADDEIWAPKIPRVKELIKLLSRTERDREIWLNSFYVVDGMVTNSGGAYFLWYSPIDGKNYALTVSGNLIDIAVNRRGLYQAYVEYIPAGEIMNYKKCGVKYHVYEQYF